MDTIQCHIGDKDYRLDYDVTPITTGRIYRGTVFTEHIVDFYLEVPNDGGEPLFSPIDADEKIKEAVIRAIKLVRGS
jgi:hypothetical protein